MYAFWTNEASTRLALRLLSRQSDRLGVVLAVESDLFFYDEQLDFGLLDDGDRTSDAEDGMARESALALGYLEATVTLDNYLLTAGAWCRLSACVLFWRAGGDREQRRSLTLWFCH